MSKVASDVSLTRRIARRVLGRDALDNRRRVLEMMPSQSVCAEIGVWKGDFSARILEVVRPAILHLIDPWRFEAGPEYSEAWYGGSAAKSQADMDAIHAAVRYRFEPQVESGRVAVRRQASAAAAEAFEDGYFDWVYIDANHQYEFVMQDLQAYWPKVKTGGMVAGDDYGTPGWWEDGVTLAVREFSAQVPATLQTLGTQFILTKRSREREGSES